MPLTPLRGHCAGSRGITIRGEGQAFFTADDSEHWDEWFRRMGTTFASHSGISELNADLKLQQPAGWIQALAKFGAKEGLKALMESEALSKLEEHGARCSNESSLVSK